MHSIFASLGILVMILSAVGVSHAGADTTDSVTLFAVGDVADCRARNPSLIPTESLNKKELAEHRIETSTWLPQESLLIEELIENEPGIVLALGDMAYPTGTLGQYKDCFAKVWGPLISRTYPVLGNHDAVAGGEGYTQFWGAAAGGPGSYYSFNYGSWHLIALNSEIEASAASPQAMFLEQDLKSVKTPCILAYFHRPAFSSLHRPHNDHARELFQLLDKYKVTLALNGHNHYYERTARLDGNGNVVADGIREFVVGTGGGKSENYGDVTPASFTEKLVIGNAGALRLDLSQGHYQWRFLSAVSGQTIDAGEGDCRGAN